MTIDEVNELVENIQRVLANANVPAEEELIDLAARHEEMVEVTTGRLREVEKLLNKGLRSEAVELAEQVPNLNDVVTVLDFPEFPVWNDFLMQFAIDPVRELPVDIASELNDAYAVSAPVERLLQRFRTQSLARSPLADRIDTLRQLSVTDSDNGQWQTDLEIFETQRVGDLKQELKAAVKRKDLDAVAILDQELSSGEWTVKVPSTLQQNAREVHQKLRKKNASEELETLTHKLSDAYADFDRSRAIPLQQRFLALAAIVGLKPIAPLYDIAGPALDWLSEEEAKATAEAEFTRGKAELEAALDRSTTIEELERLYNQTVRNGHALPQLLENRLADRIESLKTLESRRRTAWMTSIAAVCLAAIVAVVMIIQTVTFHTAVVGHETQIAVLLENARATGDVQTIDDYVSKMSAENADFETQPEILSLKEQLEAFRKEELGRRARLDELVSRAVTRGSAGAGWEDFDQAGQLLAEAETIALNEAEKTRLLTARGKIRETRDTLQQQTDAAFEAEQTAVVELISKLPKDSLHGYAAVQSRLTELQLRRHASPELKSMLSTLISKVVQQRAMVAAGLQMARSLQEITNSCGKPAQYREALIAYTREFPGTGRSEEIQSVAQGDLPLWEGVDTWNSLRQRILSASLASVPPTEAAAIIGDFDAFLKSSGPYPGRMDVSNRLKALTAIAARDTDSSGTTARQVDRMFAPRTISQSWQVVTAQDGRFFTRGKPELTGSLIQFDYFTTTTGTQSEHKRMSHTKVPRAFEKPDDAWLAPQTKLTRRLLPELKRRMETDFEDAVAFGVERFVDATDVDNILRLLLIEKLLQIGADGSLFTEAKATPHLNKIAGAGVSKLTNWAAPVDQRADDERDLAASFLDQFGQKIVADLRAAARDRQAAETTAVGPAMQCVGWLHRDTGGQWTVALTGELVISEPTVLQALGHEVATSNSHFYPICTVTQNALTAVPARDAADCLEGHPVYREVLPE